MIENHSTNSSSYEWLFCDTNFAGIPSKEKIASNYGSVYNSKFLQVGQDTYLFFVSQTQNKLVGLRFTDLTNWGYEVHCELDISAIITNPGGIDIGYENGIWIAFVSSITSPFKLVRIVFGQNFQSIVDSQDLSSGVALSTPFDVKILKDEGEYFGFVTNSTGPVNQQLARLSFGSSLSNAPLVSYIPLPVSSQASSIEFYHVCDQWISFISSRNGKIISVDFGSELRAPNPLVTNMTLNSPLNDPGGLALVEDHGELVFIIQSRNGDTYTGKITSLAENTVDITNFGNLKSTTRDWGIELLLVDGVYKVVSGNFTNGTAGGFYSLDFPAICPASDRYSSESSEMISFSQPGTYKVTLKAINADFDASSMTREVVVSNSEAPQLAIDHPAAFCMSSDVHFDFTSNTSISSQSWNFGDQIGMSSDPSPTYQYAEAGGFTVTLTTQAINGCTNFIQSEIFIYEQPAAEFELVSGLICTNNEFIFPATTPDVYNGHLTYQWFVDDSPVGTQRELSYSFTTPGSKAIKLVTAIPGCSDEVTQLTSNVQIGPVVDFGFSGKCEDDTFAFQNEVPDEVNGYLWNFDNGHTSNAPNPTQVFTEFGNFSVSLTATSLIGCENTKTKTVVVRSKPLVDFSFEGPPNTCSGTTTFFNNLTSNPDGGEIATWLWDWGETDAHPTQATQHGQYVFSQSGTYTVSLTATAESGCKAFAQRDVIIYPSPSNEILHTPACEDVPVSFSPPADNSIAYWYWEIGTAYYYAASPSHTFMAPGDYPFYAEFYGANGCISETSKTIHVPQPLIPDFLVVKNCVGQEALFTDVTVGGDPVVAREWAFGNSGSSSSSPASFTFTQAGAQSVTLQVTAQSGCSYQLTRQVQIIPPPEAAFTASPQTGAYPLEVAFTNSSSQASSFIWEFMDGTGNTSTSESPSYVFSADGSFDVRLTAYNSQQCEDSFIQRITTFSPLPDADVEGINLVPNPDGSARLIVTVNNRGNTILRSLPMTVDFGGKLSLQQIVEDVILPATRVNLVFNTSILDIGSLQYVCVSLALESDLNPSGNRMCKDFEDKLFAFPAYPNPVSDELGIEWISPGAGPVRIALSDGLGRQVYVEELTAVEGLNRLRMALEGVEGGLYFLVIDDGSARHIQRIVVVSSP